MRNHTPTPTLLAPRWSAGPCCPRRPFVPGSDLSGPATSPRPRGRLGTLPGPAGPGLHCLHALEDGSLLAMSDNGFGAKTNSQDYLLRVHHSTRRRTPGTAVRRLDGFHLTDPDRPRALDPLARRRVCPGRVAPGGLLVPIAGPHPHRLGLRPRVAAGLAGRQPLVRRRVRTVPAAHRRPGRLLEAPIPTPGVTSPSSPLLGSAGLPTSRSSKGFEGMAVSPDGRVLHPMLEGVHGRGPGRRPRPRPEDLRGPSGPPGRRGHLVGPFRRYRMEAASPRSGRLHRGERPAGPGHREGQRPPAPPRCSNGSTSWTSRDRRPTTVTSTRRLLVDLMDLGQPGAPRRVRSDHVRLPSSRSRTSSCGPRHHRGSSTTTTIRRPPAAADPRSKDVNEYLEIQLDQPLKVHRRLLPRG